MKRHRMVIREIDKDIFYQIKDGEKSIETRAYSDRFSKVQIGDTLEFVCGDEKIEKEVMKVELFPSLDKMFKSVDLKKILPNSINEDEARKVYYSFPKYEEKLKKGIFVWYLK